MPGGLMQIVAYGAQDIDLHSDSNQDINFNINSDYDYNFNNMHLNNQINTYNWYQFNRPIKKTDHNIECPITLEEINKGDTYCICNTCNTLFDAKELKKTLRTRNECPICLAEWNATIEYVNKY